MIKRAWARNAEGVEGAKAVYVHGWVYELENGRLRDLGVSAGPEGLIGDRFVKGVNEAAAAAAAATASNSNGVVPEGVRQRQSITV